LLSLIAIVDYENEDEDDDDDDNEAQSREIDRQREKRSQSERTQKFERGNVSTERKDTAAVNVRRFHCFFASELCVTSNFFGSFVMFFF